MGSQRDCDVRSGWLNRERAPCAIASHNNILTFTNTSLNRGSNQLELVRLTELEPLPEPRLVGPESDAHLAVGVNLRAVVPSEIVKLVPFDL